LEPYHSQYPKFALQRLVNILEPPETIRLELKDSVLHVSGLALHQWLADARRQVSAFPWIGKYNDGDVFNIDTRLKPPQTVTFEIKGRELYARGAASHQWIKKARNTIKAAPGILNFNDEDLTDVDLERLYRIKKELEQQTIYFKAGQKNRVEGQEDAVEKLVKQLEEFNSLALVVKKKYHIEIIGHTDGTGKEEQNLQISKARAETLRSILIAKGLTAKNFIIKGVGSTKPLRKEINEENRSFNRRVTFKATLSGS
jgi:OOP family OmpA-OmpF porin